MKRMLEKRQRRIEKILYRDRRGKAIIYNHIFVTGIAMLLQIAVAVAILTLVFYSNTKIAAPLLLLSNLVGFILVVHIINRNDRPSDKLNWVIIILTLSVFGIVMFFLYGDGRPTKQMNKKINAEKQKNYAALPVGKMLSVTPYMLSAPSLSERIRTPKKKRTANTENEATESVEIENAENHGISRYLAEFAGFPAAYDGDVTYYASGKETFDAIMQAVLSAKKFILAEYFILAPGKTLSTFLDALKKKAEEGVVVRLIFDNAGCMKALPPKYDKYVESLHPNIKCMTFNPIAPIFSVRINNRDHRKQIIVDGECAFTGGINLADEYVGEKIRFGQWKDSGFCIRGSAVNTFTMMFFNLWNAFRKDKDDTAAFYAPVDFKRASAENPLQKAACAPPEKRAFLHPYDDSPLDKESVSETVFLDVINRAERYLWIYTPYLILDAELRTALCSAAKRGVDVRIVVPGTPDKKLTYRLTKANFPPLIRAGVKLYTYTPGFIHAKSMLADDRFAVVGTINLDYRSLYLNFENAVYFSDCSIADELKKDCLSTFPECKRVSEDDLRKGWLSRLVDSLLRVFETLF